MSNKGSSGPKKRIHGHQPLPAGVRASSTPDGDREDRAGEEWTGPLVGIAQKKIEKKIKGKSARSHTTR